MGEFPALLGNGRRHGGSLWRGHQRSDPGWRGGWRQWLLDDGRGGSSMKTPRAGAEVVAIDMCLVRAAPAEARIEARQGLLPFECCGPGRWVDGSVFEGPPEHVRDCIREQADANRGWAGMKLSVRTMSPDALTGQIRYG